MNKSAQPKYFAGIDYSMSCPAVCFHPAQEEWDPTKIEIFFLIGKKKLIGSWQPMISSFEISKEKNIIFRGRENADNILNQFTHCKLEDYQVGIEGYAFGASRSLVFNIAEHTRLLKSRLINRNTRELLIIAPTTAKKFATGKGNANKEKMTLSFIEDSGIDIYKILDIEEGKITAPINDIADAYWMCKYTHHKHYGKI